jgi:hypothetical protein
VLICIGENGDNGYHGRNVAQVVCGHGCGWRAMDGGRRRWKGRWKRAGCIVGTPSIAQHCPEDGRWGSPAVVMMVRRKAVEPMAGGQSVVVGRYSRQRLLMDKAERVREY